LRDDDDDAYDDVDSTTCTTSVLPFLHWPFLKWQNHQ
jgi:hypothetical protein